MRKGKVKINGHEITVFSCNTVVVGSGAAGLNVADRLFGYGQHDVAVVTEGIDMGTSRNAGSDKQTYYKLTLAGEGCDSIRELAATFFSGGCVHGDNALCEAALSAPSFYKLVDIGVPFPKNEYGEYVGYRTDHDPKQRATSAGPLTSKYMTERLLAQVEAKNIPIFDGFKIIGVITYQNEYKGLLALDKSEESFALFNSTNVVFATGGPAGLYSCSVYPESQTGASGVAFEAGVMGANLTEWQYGIASTGFRWNLSGSYQQALPRYISTDKNGGDRQEFLTVHFPDAEKMLNAIFLKGYQWPFDSRKIDNFGSSMVDILIHNEIQEKNRRVYLDFTTNPTGLADDFGNIGKEAYSFLKNCDAFQKTPVERLKQMNLPAYKLYLEKGIDLEKELLEIAVCAQHNNGGLSVNCWWETNIKRFFAVGEAAGTHGVRRPGGSALNAGQVGGMRAAMFIADNYADEPAPDDVFAKYAETLVNKKIALAERFLSGKQGKSPKEIRTQIADRMSRYAAHIRNYDELQILAEQAKSQLETIDNEMLVDDHKDLIIAFENVDLLIAQFVYASAMANYIANGGGSRGSYLIQTNDASFKPENQALESFVQEVSYNHPACRFEWTEVRRIPSADDWFETVWKKFIEKK